MAAAVESWDDDADFHGDFQAFAGQSAGTAHTNVSSRMSVQSESQAGDDDWNVVLQPNDQQSSVQAVQSARQAGIPLPNNVPISALLGGTIKRLGKKKSRVKIGDDWDNDLEVPEGKSLQLQPKPRESFGDDFDDFDDLEGSLGIRFGGTRRDTRARSSSVSIISPSVCSQTAESEADEMRGLEMPEGPVDFEDILKKRRVAEAELSDISQPSPATDHTEPLNTHKKSKLRSDEADDYLNDFDLSGGGILDNPKRAINKNLKLRSTKPATSSPRPATTLNFHDKPIDKPTHSRSHLPRPVSGIKSSKRLEPVFEIGASHVPRERRHAAATTTSSQLLRAKRSMPVLSSRHLGAHANKTPSSFLTAGASLYQSPGVPNTRAVPYHLRRDSDPNNRRGAASPPPRPSSRLSNTFAPETPSRVPRQRLDLAPAALAREAAAKRTLTRPSRRRNFGDGSELDIFDDLPTSTTKESRYVKQPIARGPPKLGLRQTQSRSDIREAPKRNVAVPERMMTPAPARAITSPVKGLYEPVSSTPNYLRDTAASRIARETRLNNPRPRSEGPLMPVTMNWKAQIAARSPQSSPSAHKQRPKRSSPTLIKNIGLNMARNEKGMIYNPHTMRWEGNENMLSHFDLPPPLETPTPTSTFEHAAFMNGFDAPPPSPPRPALIAPAMSGATQGVQVNSGMVFDPQQMKWLKLKENRERLSGPLTPSITDGEDDDPLAAIPDLVEEPSPALLGPGIASPVSMMGGSTVADVHEEFDLGPVFINRQREEELLWRRHCENWFAGTQPRSDDGGWRWSIREIIQSDDLVV